MAYAPESGSDRVRKAVRKRVEAEGFYASVRSSTRAGLNAQVFFIMGFPGERLADLFATLRMIARLAWMGVEDVAVSHYMPYPGSEIHDRLLEEGRLDRSDRWLLAPHHRHGAFLRNAWQLNEHYGPVVQGLFVLSGTGLFYAVTTLRKPTDIGRILTGIFRRPEHDSARLERALETLLGPRLGQRSRG